MSESGIDATLEITRECPLNCLICSSNGGKPYPTELSLNEWEKIIDDLTEIGVKSILISGGEPFSCKFLKDICQYIIKKQIPLSIYSSGNYKENNNLIPLKIEDLEFISKLGPIRLVFSLEGATSNIHDEMTCQQGSFDNALISISRAIDLGFSIDVHFVPTKMNYKELPAVVSLSKKIGVEKVSVLRFVPQGRGIINKNLIELNKQELYKLKEIYSDLEKLSPYVRIGSPFNPFLLSKQYKCTAGYNRLTITPNGLVVPCEAFKFIANKFEDNDLKKSTLKYVWTESRLFNWVRNLNKLILSDHCKLCEYLDQCGGGCPAQKILTSQNENIDPICVKKLQKIPAFIPT